MKVSMDGSSINWKLWDFLTDYWIIKSHLYLSFYLLATVLFTCITVSTTAWKVTVFGVFLVLIFPHFNWIWISHKLVNSRDKYERAIFSGSENSTWRSIKRWHSERRHNKEKALWCKKPWRFAKATEVENKECQTAGEKRREERKRIVKKSSLFEQQKRFY